MEATSMICVQTAGGNLVILPTMVYRQTCPMSITHPVKNLLKTSEASLNLNASYPYNF